MFFRKKKFETIDVNQIKEIKDAKVIDVRTLKEYKDNHIKNSQNIEMSILLESPEKFLDKDRDYYIVCQSGMRSKITCSKLAKKGYHIVNLSGGMNRYENV